MPSSKLSNLYFHKHKYSNFLDPMFFFFSMRRYDKEGHAMDGQSLTDVKGGGGGNTNWKSLSDVKTEHLGHGEKVQEQPCTDSVQCPNHMK